MHFRSFPDAKPPLFQIFLKDPDDVTIELNFLGEKINEDEWKGKGSASALTLKKSAGKKTEIAKQTYPRARRRLSRRPQGRAEELSRSDARSGRGGDRDEGLGHVRLGSQVLPLGARRGTGCAGPGQSLRTVRRRPRALRRGRGARPWRVREGSAAAPARHGSSLRRLRRVLALPRWLVAAL